MNEPNTAPLKDASRWRILVVDDNMVNRKLMLAVLQNTAVCDVASNGREAIDKYMLAFQQNTPFHLILLDVAMPVVDGLEVLRVIREHEKKQGVETGKGVFIIMVTAHRETVFDAYNMGCDDYIVKPIRPDILIEKIIQRLSTRQ